MKTQLISFAAACVACVKGTELQGNFLATMLGETNNSQIITGALGANGQSAAGALGATQYEELLGTTSSGVA